MYSLLITGSLTIWDSISNPPTFAKVNLYLVEGLVSNYPFSTLAVIVFGRVNWAVKGFKLSPFLYSTTPEPFAIVFSMFSSTVVYFFKTPDVESYSSELLTNRGLWAPLGLWYPLELISQSYGETFLIYVYVSFISLSSFSFTYTGTECLSLWAWFIFFVDVVLAWL